jgi:peptide/nickel transport system ATP-binding protein/oligopeptide transport system ATP-binding protein
MSDILLRVEDLRTHFYTHDGVVKAVDGVDFLIHRGETLGLVGESGCGKSVTARSILRLLQEPPGRIAAGKILFDDLDLVRLTPRQIRKIRGNRISMIFQEPMTSLNPVFSIGSQMADSLCLHQRLTKKKALDRAVELLAEVLIPDPEKRIDEYPHQLSGGMRQRVMIAMALSCHPEVLIADEPTTALDVTIQAQILYLMNKVKRDSGASVLLITHDLAVISEMADSVAVMYAGKIVEQAGVKEIFLNPGHPYTRGLMESIPRMDLPPPEDRILKTIPGTVPSLLNLPGGCAFRERCSRAVDPCKRETPRLVPVGPDHHVACWLYGKE